MEQPRNPRTYIGPIVEVLDQANNQPIGNLCDLSPTGLMLVGEICPAENQSYHLLAFYPNKEKAISFRAMCRWAKPGALENSFESGFLLEEQTSEINREFKEMATEFDFFGESDNLP